jgi:outer membrane protein OmpA-like peptidoglycan-associated protein
MPMNRHLPLWSILPALLLGACASNSVTLNSSLDEARSQYAKALRDAQVARLAPSELSAAGAALAKANEAAKKSDHRLTNHLAYLARQRVAIAVETANQHQAEQELANAVAQRDKLLQNGRSAEAELLYQKTESLRQELETSRRQFEQSRRAAPRSDARAPATDLETALAEFNPRKGERGTTITLGDTGFDRGRSELTAESRRSVRKIASVLARFPARKIRIEGFTDDVGEASYNQYLSERRADAVRLAFAEAGIDNERMTTRGYGEIHPAASNATEEMRQLNRRVEIVIADEGKNVAAR